MNRKYRREGGGNKGLDLGPSNRGGSGIVISKWLVEYHPEPFLGQVL